MEQNSLNLKDFHTNRIKEVKKEKEYNEIEWFSNNYKLKVSLVNIDSRFRNRIPKNIIDTNPIFLTTDPLYTTENSYEIKLYVENHNFKIGDNIVLQNISNNTITLSNPIYLVANFNYFLLKVEDHGISGITHSADFVNGLEFKINITNYDDLTNSDRMIGNIPINSILGVHSINIYNNISLQDNIETDILNNLNITLDTLKKDYFFIKLPFEYSKINKINDDTVFSDFYNIKKIFNIDYLHIGGIPLAYLNANYPINYYQYKYAHNITKVETNYIYFNSDVKANFTKQSGGKKIYIGKVLKSIEGYPEPDDYTIELKNSFTDVVRIELLTTEIPFIEFNIKKTYLQTGNNKLYWKYLEDGNYIYSIEVDEGYYDTDSLITTLTTKMNKLLRISSTIREKIYNLFTIDINKNSQEVNFNSFKLQLLPHCLKIEQDELLNDAIKLVIKHPNNFLNVGDKITISDASAIGDVLASAINGEHEIYEVNSVADTYTIILQIDINTDSFNTEGTGGPIVKIQIPAKVSFLFNKNDTIGKLLGFKNVGSVNAITPFSSITSNFNDYIEPTIYNEVGDLDVDNHLLNLTGDHFYLLMYLNDFEGVITNTGSDNAFSKILLVGSSGDIMFNTFINSPLEFNIPVASINEFKIKFQYPDGSKVNFRNYNHSFTLRITELISRPSRTGIISKKDNYLGAMIEKHTMDI